jgi:uncharacterized protein
MFVDVTQIPVEGLDVEFRETENFLGSSGKAISLLQPVEATLHFLRAPTEVWVRGQVSSVLQLNCSRCSEPFLFPVDEAFTVRYRGPLTSEAEEEHALDVEELDVDFLHEDLINVSELIRENILLALPVKPLCREGCRGLCPQCGTNLNEDTCRCSSGSSDPRWRGLERLR